MDNIDYLPLLPIITDSNGLDRFRGNKIIKDLQEKGIISLNDIDFEEYDSVDIDNFYQLIGSSIRYYVNLNDVSDIGSKVAEKAYESEYKINGDLILIQELQSKLRSLEKSLKDLLVDNYNAHPDTVDEIIK